MRFVTNPIPKEKEIMKYRREKCIPGEVYEAVFTGDKPKDFPTVQNLRLCVKDDKTSQLRLVHLEVGRISAHHPKSAIYRPRPDVFLTFGEE